MLPRVIKGGSTLAIRAGKPYRPPAYCYACGTAFPWTAAKLRAAKELADELDDLSEADRNKLKRSLDDLVAGGPKTEVAVLRFKKLMSTVSKEGVAAMRSIVVDVVSEAAKKMLFGG